MRQDAISNGQKSHLDDVLDFISSLLERLTDSSSRQPLADTQARLLCDQLVARIAAVRKPNAADPVVRDDDLLRRLDRQAIALWNLTTRLKRGWTAGESIAAQDGSRELLLLPIYSDTWLTAGTSDLTADGSTTTPNQHPVPLLRIFVFHVLDTVFRAGRSHSASAKQAHSERWKDTIRLLRVALKASRQCLEIHLLEHAIKILERAADCLDDLEKQQRVRTSSTIAGEEEQDRARMARDLRLEYLGLRMTLAWKQQNLDVASMMFDQASATLSSEQDTAKIEQLADLTYEIGKDLLKKSDFYRASKWLQRAHDLLRGLDAEAVGPDIEELDLGVGHRLVLSLLGLKTEDARGKACSVLEWMESGAPGKMVTLILGLDLIKSAETFDATRFTEVLSRLTRSVYLTPANFNTILSHIRCLKDHDIVAACKALDELLLMRLIDHDNHDWIEKVFITRLWMTSSDELDTSATSLAEQLHQCMQAMSGSMQNGLSTSATHAAQTLLWKRIDSAMKGEDWPAADAWSHLALHPLLSNTEASNTAKIARKLISCAIARRDLISARSTYNQMPEAARKVPLTRYLAYKIALRSHDEAFAAECFETIARHANHDPKLLHACALEAQQSGNRQEAIKVLRTVLSQCSSGQQPDIHLPSLLRCTLKLMVAELSSPSTHELGVVSQICDVFEASVKALKQQPLPRAGATPVFDDRELNWLVTNSYNLALKHYTSWPPETVLRLLESCIALSDHGWNDASKSAGLRQSLPTKPTSHICHSLAAQTLLKLARVEADHTQQATHYASIRTHVAAFHRFLDSHHSCVQSNHSTDVESLQQIHRRLLITDFEAAIRLRAWDDLGILIDRCANSAITQKDKQKTLQVMADMLLSSCASTSTCSSDFLNYEQDGETSMPAAITMEALQMIVAASSTSATLSDTQKLARWYRILFQLSLRRPSSSHTSTNSDGTTKTEEILHQILQYLQTTLTSAPASQIPYPQEELEYLVALAWNTAVDACIAGNMENCGRLGGLSVELAGWMGDGGDLEKTLRGRLAQLTGVEGCEDGDGDGDGDVRGAGGMGQGGGGRNDDVVMG